MADFEFDPVLILFVLGALLGTGIVLSIIAIILLLNIKNRKNNNRITDTEDNTSQENETENRPRFWRRIWGFIHAPAGSPALTASFRQGIKLLKSYFPRRDYLYKYPWFLFLGETGSGKTSALVNSRINMPLGKPINDNLIGNKSCTWWLFDAGVLLDVAGEIFTGGDHKKSQFKDFLRLLSWFRPKRPADGIILAIPATDFVGEQRLSQEALLDKYRDINRRLDRMQNMLGIVLPIYVVVTKIDSVRGFRQFWDQIPLNRQMEIFGWSNPNSLNEMYSETWIEDAFKILNKSLTEIQLEIAASVESTPGDYDDGLYFPSDFQNLKEPITQILTQMLRTNSPYENFVLRGIYFTGSLNSPESLFSKTADSTSHLPQENTILPELTDSEGIPIATTKIIQSNNLRVVTDQIRGSLNSTYTILFDHLLDKKILYEKNLSSPILDTLISRKNTKKYFQFLSAGIVIFFSLSLLFYGVDLAKKSSVAKSTLHDMAQTIEELRIHEERLKVEQATYTHGCVSNPSDNHACEKYSKKLQFSFVENKIIGDLT